MEPLNFIERSALWIYRLLLNPRVNVFGLFLFILVTHGAPVPEPLTEYLYLPCLVKQYNPSFMSSDWTLSGPWYEHLVFNMTFGLFALVMPLEWVGWLGRLGCWVLFALGFQRLGERLRIPPWMTSLAVALWLLKGQSIVASSWMIGGFEAKSLGYLFFIYSLNAFLRERRYLGSLLLGLSFSFHPAVGLSGGLAIGFSLLFQHKSWRELSTLAGLVFLAALPGAISIFLLLGQGGTSDPEIWKFITLTHSHHHFDPLSWARRDIVFTYLLFGFSWLYYRDHRSDKVLRFLFYIQLFLGLFFALGLFWRITGQYTLLRYFPFRLFPLLVPLLFLLQIMHAFLFHREHPLGTVTAVIGLLGLLGFGNTFGQFVDRINLNRGYYATYKDPAARSFQWIKHNTPKDAMMIAPPWRGDSIFLSQRGQIASWWAIRYDKLAEWRLRISEILGEIPQASAKKQQELMERRYRGLSLKKLRVLSRKYNTRYLVSPTTYRLPVLFKTSTYKVYSLQPLLSGLSTWRSSRPLRRGP